MSLVENFVVGGCIAAAAAVSAFFIREGNRLHKEGHPREGKIVMVGGAVIGAFSVANAIFVFRK